MPRSVVALRATGKLVSFQGAAVTLREVKQLVFRRRPDLWRPAAAAAAAPAAVPRRRAAFQAALWGSMGFTLGGGTEGVFRWAKDRWWNDKEE